jgi:zinc protease
MKKCSIFTAAFISAFVCCGVSTPASAAPYFPATPIGRQPASADLSAQIRFAVEKLKMPNGLTVLIHEDHSAPIVSYQTWFRVGSKNEEPGYTGIAHLFEHMMFKGAKRYSGEKLEVILQANGAVNNAFTTHDYTGYYENLPSSKLELVMDIESDRMENLQITPENLKSEREVVKEERRFRVDNNPFGTLSESVFGTAYKVHPYHWPVIGYMNDLDNITLEKAVEFYHTYYAPNNAVVVIAGDVDPTDCKRLLNKYYGGIKAQSIPVKTRPNEPQQMGTRSVEVERDVQTHQFAVAYRTPAAGVEDSYALDLLANIMGTGHSSRLYNRVVYQDQLASSVSTNNITLQDSGLFEIVVQMKPGASYYKAQRAIYAEMWRPRSLKISDLELQKVKNQVMKGYVDGLKTVHGRAEALALNEVLFGDYERLFKDLDMYQQVTSEQVKKAAEKYLTAEKSTFALLKPKKKGAR